MTLTEKLFEEKVETDDYVGKAQVWRSDRGGHNVIRCKIEKKVGRFCYVKQEVNSWRPRKDIFSKERFEKALDNLSDKVAEYQDDKEKFDSAEVIFEIED
jgi:hypothetical protein